MYRKYNEASVRRTEQREDNVQFLLFGQLEPEPNNTLTRGSSSRHRPFKHALTEHVQVHRVYLHYGSTPRVIRLPWSQLTDFNSEFSGVKECLDSLAWLPNLVRLGIILHDEESNSSDRRPIIQLSQLTTLAIVLYADPGRLFDHLMLPALRDFECYKEQFGWSCQLASMLSRSSSSLHRLSVERASI
jgi:hypothetical protein